MRVIVTICILMLFQVSQAQVTQQMTVEKMRFNILKLDRAIGSTKKKIKNIRDAKFLPDLYMSLAEFYVTKSKFKYALKIAENKDVPLNELDFTFEKRLKFNAIETYDILIDKFPKFVERDKAIFFKAHEQRELGLKKEMVVSYNQLSKEYPKSAFWPESQIIIGDHYFESKKNLDIALSVYQKVLKKPVSAFTPLAHHKIGWVYIHKRNFYEALRSFEKVLKNYQNIDLEALPANLRKTDVREDALLALVWPYSELNKKQMKKAKIRRGEPLDYFKSLSPDKKSYARALKKLGRRLTIKSRYILATRVYFELLRLTNDLKGRMDIIERLYVSMKNTQKNWPVKGFVDEIVKTMPQIKYSTDLKKAEKKKAFYDYEIYARDVATRQDKRSRLLKKQSEYEWAIKDYESYLATFNKRKYRTKIILNLANVYFFANQYVKAAKLFEIAAKRSKLKGQKNAHLQSSLQSYISALKDPDSLNRLELTESRYGLRSVGFRFIKSNPKHEAVPKLYFSIGQSYYDERLFEDSVKTLKQFIAGFPAHKDTSVAVNLILDAYHQTESYDSLIKYGRSVLSNKRIQNPQLKNQVQQIVQQAEMKKVEQASGDFSSKSYATNLLKMASKHKGSSLGDKALYEAFLAFKAKKDPKAYEVGTDLALRHKNSKYAFSVITDMGQMALQSADFKRAALFFELYHERYPGKKEAVDLLKSAAEMREFMGDYKIASEDYSKLKNYTDAARMDFIGAYWTNLIRSSSRASGIWKDYWGGLATYRLKGLRAAKPALLRASQYKGASASEKEAAAHALYLLSMDKLQNYKKIQIQLGNETKAVNDKAAGLKSLEEELNKVIRFGNGRWTIAALYGLGQSYQEFSDFLLKAPLPKGLSAQDQKLYKAAIAKQAKTYSSSAKSYFARCVSAAEKNSVFTQFVKGCLSRGKFQVDEEKDLQVYSSYQKAEPAGAAQIRRKLLSNSRDLKLLNKLSLLYIKKKNYSMAELVQKHILQMFEDNANAMAHIGVIKLHKNELQEAYTWFQRSLKNNAKQSAALYGLAGLYKAFYFKKKLRSARSKAKARKLPKDFVHKYMRAI